MYKPARRTGRTTRMLEYALKRAALEPVYVVAYDYNHEQTLWSIVSDITNGRVRKGTLTNLRIITREAQWQVPGGVEMIWDHWTLECMNDYTLDQIHRFDQE